MTTDKSAEREPTTRVKTFDDKTLVVEAATGAVIKNYHPRLTSMAVAFHEGIEYARAALPQQAQDPRRFEWLLNNYPSLMCTHRGMAPSVSFQRCLLHKDFTPDMLRDAIDAAIAKGERQL